MSPLAEEHIEMLRARNERLATSLKALVRQLERIGGHTTHDEQGELRIARSILAEER